MKTILSEMAINHGILFNMPSYPIKSVVEVNQYLHKYVEENYSSVPFLDYELMQLPDSCYGDASHLNYRVALVVSEKIAEDVALYDYYAQ